MKRKQFTFKVELSSSKNFCEPENGFNHLRQACQTRGTRCLLKNVLQTKKDWVKAR